MSGAKRRRNLRILRRPTLPRVEKHLASNIKRTLKVAGWATSGLLALSGLLPFLAGPSVQSPVPLGRNNPLSLFFEVTNESPLPIFGVRSHCEIDANTENNISIFDAIVGEDLSNKSVVLGRARFTVDCAAFSTGSPIVLPARTSILISFNHFLWPFRWERRFSFTARKQEDGSAGWLPDLN